MLSLMFFFFFSLNKNRRVKRESQCFSAKAVERMLRKGKGVLFLFYNPAEC